MATSREGTRLARSLARGSLHTRNPAICARRFASTDAQKPASSRPDDLKEIEANSSFTTSAPSADMVQEFEAAQASARDRKLPGTRYQFHPPKYDRGPLHPIQSPASSDPIARDFVAGPFNVPRLRHTYESTIAPDILTLTYQHKPPGYVAPASDKGVLREWDGSSPYHKNRPRRGPRGPGSSRLGLLERDISFNNIPEITGVTIQANAGKSSSHDKEFLKAARSVVQAITGQFPQITKVKRQVAAWSVRKNDAAGAVVNLEGTQAWEFVDKLFTLVLPKIKDWNGINASTGDDHGNIALGIKPEWMAFFPELEYNYASYPTRMVPGLHIFIKTSGTSDRHGRLLLEAMGLPFHGKVKH